MSANPALGAVLLVGYSYAVVGAIYFGTRAALRCRTETTLRFPFYPLALANLAVCAVVLVNLLVPGAFFTAGLWLIILQFVASVALGVVYVVADLVYGCYARPAPVVTEVVVVRPTRGVDPRMRR